MRRFALSITSLLQMFAPDNWMIHPVQSRKRALVVMVARAGFPQGKSLRPRLSLKRSQSLSLNAHASLPDSHSQRQRLRECQPSTACSTTRPGSGPMATGI
jgi:hypothetical protein